MNNSVLSKEFEKRYNRKVIIDTDSGKYKETQNEKTLRYRDKTFKLTEHLVEGLTDFVIVNFNSKDYRFRTYLEAEVFVADKIGEE